MHRRLVGTVVLALTGMLSRPVWAGDQVEQHGSGSVGTNTGTVTIYNYGAGAPPAPGRPSVPLPSTWIAAGSGLRILDDVEVVVGSVSEGSRGLHRANVTLSVPNRKTRPARMTPGNTVKFDYKQRYYEMKVNDVDLDGARAKIEVRETGWGGRRAQN